MDLIFGIERSPVLINQGAEEVLQKDLSELEV